VTAEPTRVEVPFQPMQQLLAIVATLAAHGVSVNHHLTAFDIPRRLFDQLPGYNERLLNGGSWCKRIEWKVDGITRSELTLYTSEPPAAQA
jgi:hypothetical protein